MTHSDSYWLGCFRQIAESVARPDASDETRRITRRHAAETLAEYAAERAEARIVGDLQLAAAAANTETAP